MVDLLFCFSSRIFHPIAGRLRGSYFSWWNFQILSPAGCRQGCGGKLLFSLLVFGSGRALVGWYACKARLGLVLASQAKVHYEFACVMFWRFFSWDFNEKILYFVWSPPWHLYLLLLANLLTFYLAHLLAFYLTYLLAFYLANLLAFYLAYLLAFYLAFYLAYLLAYLLTSYLAFYLANLLAFYLANILALYLAYPVALYLAYLLAFYLAYLLAYHLANLLAFYLANILTLYLAYLLAFYLTFYLAFYLAYLLAFYLAYLRTFYLPYLLAYHLANLMEFYLAYILAFYLAVEAQRCTLSWAGPRLRLRSGGAHWAGKVPGWGPAVHTELGRSQVEVQQCTLEKRRRRRRRTKRRRRRRRRTRRRTTALIKSNNPHLAGGEIHVDCARDVSLIAATFYDLRNSLAPAVNHCEKKCSWCNFSGVMCRVFFTAPATQDVPWMWVKSTPQ